MPKFVILANWTPKGIEAFRETTHRAEEFGHTVEKAGGRLVELLWTLGEYDVVAIAEAPDDKTMTAVLLQLCAAGNIRTKTLPAFDAQEMNEILQRTQ